MALRLCDSCTRHVRVSEATCPFCSAALPQIASAPTRAGGRATSRSALVFFGAAATVAACSNSATLYGTAVVNDASLPNASDGGDGGDAADANDDADQPVPMYGPAVIDAGED